MKLLFRAGDDRIRCSIGKRTHRLRGIYMKIAEKRSASLPLGINLEYCRLHANIYVIYVPLHFYICNYFSGENNFLVFHKEERLRNISLIPPAIFKSFLIIYTEYILYFSNIALYLNLI